MSTTVCGKCGWETDSAKAFCPDCGEPFVEEKSNEQPSEFADAGKTKQFSASIFNAIVNADEAPVPTPAAVAPNPAPAPAPAPALEPKPAPKVREAGVSSIKPLGPSAKSAGATAGKPASRATEPAVQSAQSPGLQKKGGKLKWVVIAVIALVFVFVIALGVGGFIAWYYFKSKFGM